MRPENFVAANSVTVTVPLSGILGEPAKPARSSPARRRHRRRHC